MCVCVCVCVAGGGEGKRDQSPPCEAVQPLESVPLPCAQCPPAYALPLPSGGVLLLPLARASLWLPTNNDGRAQIPRPTHTTTHTRRL